jgi:hypothetical protein
MMNKQLILTTAVAAFMLSAGSLAATSAFAGHGGGRSGGRGHHLSFNGSHHNGGEHHNGHSDFHRRDHDGDERFAYRHHDHHRRFWHGTWYEYGVGLCWRWSDDDHEYVWVCGEDD